MRNTNIFRVSLGIVSLLFLFACNFEETNINPYEIHNDKYDDIAIGGPITAMQTSVVPVGTQADGTNVVNQYQIAYHLSGDVWGGYFGQNANWHSGNNHTTNYLVDAWVSASYRNSYSNLLPSWKRIRELSKENNIPEAFALAQVLKISAWHKTTDMFGPIPYKSAGEPILVVPYDSQEDVYYYFLADLEKAIEILTEKAGQGVQVAPDFDAVYAGNITKWVKYANSLMLRLAMRIRYAEPDSAKKYAEMAVNHSLGVMVEKVDMAKMEKGAGLVFVNNIETTANQYAETRMSSTMFSYLMGYEDPRISAYFNPSKSEHAVTAFDGKKYHAVPTGHVKATNEIFKSFSIPNIEKLTPTYWMKASEVYFLRAEGALIGWDMKEDASALYHKGITMSFEENGIAADKMSPYVTSGNEPVKYELNVGWTYRFSSPAPTSATAEFIGNMEEKLEKIIIQKWIAMYPDGQEAWSEWRRTGYPKLHDVDEDRGGLGKGRVRRMNYPAISYQSEKDKENILNAVRMLEGEDKPSTKLWWDKKN